MKSLKRALQEDDVLEGAQAKFDGRFVYVVGVEGRAPCAPGDPGVEGVRGARTHSKPRRDAGSCSVRRDARLSSRQALPRNSGCYDRISARCSAHARRLTPADGQ